MSDVQWDVPGWDWAEGDYAWLASESGIYHDGVSIFFIHGGRIRHQASMPQGSYTREELLAWFDEHAEGLEDPHLNWTHDTGGGDCGLWLEGTRPPNKDDLARLEAARERQRRNDEIELRGIEARRAADAWRKAQA